VPQLNATPNDLGINFARQTQTTISPALFNLPAEAIAGCPDLADPVCNGTGDLIARDFARGNYDGLASGQAIRAGARFPRDLSAVDQPDRGLRVQHRNAADLLRHGRGSKKARQPLGCVGQSIIAQTFIQVLWDTPDSILHTNFRPDPSLIKLAPETPKFSFGDLLVDTGLAPRTS
jgi:hypothetical protein